MRVKKFFLGNLNSLGYRYNLSNIIERSRFKGRGVLVWKGIMLGCRTDLHIFFGGSITGIYYSNVILLPYVIFLEDLLDLQFLFMGNNEPGQCTVVVKELLDR